MSTYEAVKEGEGAALLIVLTNGERLIHSRGYSSVDAAIEKGEELFGSLEEEKPKEQSERVRVLREAISSARPDANAEQPLPDSGAVVAGHLAPELGSDPIMKARGTYDMRRMGISSRRLIVAKNWLSWRATKAGGNNRFWQHIVVEDDNRSPSVEGLGRRQAIQMQGATVGGHTPVETEKPGWLQRNVTKRDWKDEQEREMRGY